MRYQGGKSGTGRKIAPYLRAGAGPGVTYYEPFVGAGAVARHVAGAFERAVLSDAMPDLVLLWQALADGWSPPAEMSREEWARLRGSAPSALRAFAGFGCSFGGKWFGGYSDGTKGDGAPTAARTLAAKVAEIGPRAEFLCRDYRQVSPLPGDVVYLDPPYAGTTPYAGAPSRVFDSSELWAHADTWTSLGARVFVSEHSAPVGWVRVWYRPRSLRMRGSGSQADCLFARPETVAALDLEVAA